MGALEGRLRQLYLRVRRRKILVILRPSVGGVPDEARIEMPAGHVELMAIPKRRDNAILQFNPVCVVVRDLDVVDGGKYRARRQRHILGVCRRRPGKCARGEQ
ncbi:hypothetical protein D9M69_582290 [compost metagenome]